MPRRAWTVGVAVVLIGSAAIADGPGPAAEFAAMKREFEAAGDALAKGIEGSPSQADRDRAVSAYREASGAIARRVLGLARAHPDAPEAPEALVWIFFGLGVEDRAIEDAAYDLLIDRYLDRDVLLPFCRIAWVRSIGPVTSERFLRAGATRSPNPRVKALCRFSLARFSEQIATLVGLLDDPRWVENCRKFEGEAAIERLRKEDPAARKAEAIDLFERVIREDSALRPVGPNWAPLGEQAAGALFQIKNLGRGCNLPELVGEDLDGRPMTLSEVVRGRVVVLTFWATWCGPCMASVPDEKALVERMKGRPFALVGVDGDDDREAARAVVAEKGINWRSFWDGGRVKGTAVAWGISGWPTVYLVDAKGIIRKIDLRGAELDAAVEALVSEAEKSPKP